MIITRDELECLLMSGSGIAQEVGSRILERDVESKVESMLKKDRVLYDIDAEVIGKFIDCYTKAVTKRLKYGAENREAARKCSEVFMGAEPVKPKAKAIILRKKGEHNDDC